MSPRDELDERIAAYYLGTSMATSGVDEIKERIDAERTTSSRPRRLLRGVIAATLALATVALVVVALQRATSSRFAHDVAVEIAWNHNKALDPEFTSDDFEGFRVQMPELDFTPVRPHRLHLELLHLVGARYCSVQDTVAVQIRMRDERGRLHTLYEFRDDGSFATLDEHDEHIDGVRVELWRESGLVMGLAGPAS